MKTLLKESKLKLHQMALELSSRLFLNVRKTVNFRATFKGFGEI